MGIFEGRERRQDSEETTIESAGQRLKIVLFAPVSTEEVRRCGDAIKAGTVVVLNMEHLDSAGSRRAVDFMEGVIYTVGASGRQVSDQVIVYAPRRIEIGADMHG